MKSLTDLWRELAIELASWCHTSATNDYKKLVRRVESEGLSFLTITLPSFGKNFEYCLDKGRVDDCDFSGFRKKRGLPLFLEGFLRQIFDVSTGVLLAQPSHDSIFAVRQLTLVFGKINVACSDGRTRFAFESYVKCEQDLSSWETSNSFDDSSFERISQLLFADVFAKMDQIIFDGDLIPRHGPGQTADRVSGNQKYDLLQWSERLEELFPFGEYALPNWRYYYRYDDIEILEPGAEIPVRVIAVPKTLSTPRIIAMEPAHVQYMQQAVLIPLIQNLEAKVVEGNTRDNLSSYFLGFTDQDPNRDLACRGSKGDDLATLDLSEASDRVHILHVEAMMRRFPSFWKAILATRSTKAEILPLGIQLNSLRKFASMGSALCFPVEAMVFLTAVFLGIEEMQGHLLTRKEILSYVGKVRVYGDDIIIPIGSVPYVSSVLARLGFKINTSKSFWTGKFRESCGGDYYDGTDVTPVRLRHMLPSSRSDIEELQSLVAFRNLLYWRGLWNTTSWLDNKIRSRNLLRHFPIVQSTAPCLGRQSVLPYEAERIDDYLHAPRVRAWVVKSTIPASEASGVGSLIKCLLSLVRREPDDLSVIFPDTVDNRHLQFAGRPSAVDIKLKWSAPF